MTLHDAIIKLLQEKGRAMSVKEITAELNEKGWFTKKDNSEICDFQVHGRTWSYSSLFRREGDMVSLVDEKNK